MFGLALRVWPGRWGLGVSWRGGMPVAGGGRGIGGGAEVWAGLSYWQGLLVAVKWMRISVGVVDYVLG